MLILKARVSVNFQGFMLFVALQYSSRIHINGIHFWRAQCVFNQVLGFIPLFSVCFCCPFAPFYLSFSLSYEFCFILQGKSDRCIWISSIYCCRQAYFIGIFWEKRGRTNIDSDIHFTVEHISMFQCFNFSNNIWLKLQAWKRAWSSLFPVPFRWSR